MRMDPVVATTPMSLDCRLNGIDFGPGKVSGIVAENELPVFSSLPPGGIGMVQPVLNSLSGGSHISLRDQVQVIRKDLVKNRELHGHHR